MSDDPFSIPPENVTNGQLYMALQSLRAQVGDVADEQTRLRTDFEADRRDKADMVAAWKAGGAVMKLIKLLGSLAIAAGAIFAFLKGGSAQ